MRRASPLQLGLFDVPSPPPEAADAAARRAARELATDLVLRAGPGTGKTHTLVQAVVGLVRRGVAQSRILLVTFSEKAAGELRERVRADGLTDIHIGTFHGFAAGMLRRHAAAAGLDPGFQLLEDDQSRSLLRVAAEEAVLAALAEPPVRALVRELDFARGDDAPARGLVEHLGELVVRLREEGREPADLTADVDDASAAMDPGEYRAALAELIAGLDGAGSARLIEHRAELIELTAKTEKALDDLDPARDPLADPSLRRVVELTRGSLGNPARHEAQRRLRAAETALRAVHVAHRAAPLARAFLALAGDSLRRYQAAKTAAGALDFADLLLGARALLRDDAVAAVRQNEQARWDAVLVDELQDANALQDDLIELVRAPSTRLLAVGDPKQSIYEFRGADVAVFERVAARVGHVRALTETRRALAPLTRFLNRLFARVMVPGTQPFEIAFDSMHDVLQPTRGGQGVCVELLEGQPEPVAVARRVRALVEQGSARYGDVAILLRRFTRLDALLDALRRAGVPHHVVNGRGFYAAQEVRDLAHALTLLDDPDDALALLGVLRSPLVGVSDGGLVALADLAGARAPLALAPLLRAAQFPGLGAGEAERLRGFLGLYQRLRRHADRLGAAGVLRALLDETDMPAVVATTCDGEQRVANLERLVTLAEQHDGDRRAFVRRLGAEAARERSLHAPAQILDERDDVVRVMTIHQSKGLEFPVVFVPECGAAEREEQGAVVYDRAAGLGFRVRLDDGERFASPRARAAEELRRARARAESTRLFYVACTRARDLLVLSGEAGRGANWRKLVDEWIAADGEAPGLIRRRSLEPAPPPPPLAAPAPIPAGEVVRLSRLLAAPATGARTLVAPATQLADFAACPRRYHLRHEVGLEEHPRAPAAEPGLDATLDAGERGSAAHRLLERIDLQGYSEAALVALAESEGLPADHSTAEIIKQIDAFLNTRFGRQLRQRQPSDVRREVPFALAAGDHPRLLVKGKIDLVLGDPLTVIDYKLSQRNKETDRDHRFQLLVYAAAARAIWGQVPRVGLVYLREKNPTPRFFPVGDAQLDRCLAELAAMAADLAESRRTGHFAGRELAVCQDLGCGFVSRCHSRLICRTSVPPG